MNKKEILISYEMPAEDEVKIISSFTESQRALFHTMLTDTILKRAEIQFVASDPYAHIQLAANMDGKRELLELLLSVSSNIDNAEA